MPPKKSDVLTITKLEAAHRQIETAITLWFEDGDDVSIHTLMAAGHQICHAITKHRKEKVSQLFNFDWLDPKWHDHYKSFLLRPENFFKHARKDPDEMVEYSRALTDVYLFDACRLFCHLNGVKTPLIMAFEFRIQLSYPEIFPKDFRQMLAHPDFVEFGRLSKKEFLKQFRKILPLLERV